MNCFRNYRRLQLEVTKKRLLIIGSNGIGKSNLLEAVELLGSLRSHRAGHDKDLIFWNENKAILRAIAETDEKLELELRVRGGRKASRNGKLLERQLDLLGPLRCVGFSALDLDLVRGEPSLRRSWLDKAVLQLEPIYSDLISRYTKLLRQRTQLWRYNNGAPPQKIDTLLDAFDSQMALISTRIHRRRKRLLTRLQPLANVWQRKLSQGNEDLVLNYLPGSFLETNEDEVGWKNSIENQLLNQRENEEKLGICKIGPHRDEVEFLLNGMQARRFGSSGQQRTIVISLKLAELELIGQLYGEPPLLLLDDVLAELDPHRQLLLLDAVGNEHQCLISATHLDAFEKDWNSNSQILKLDN